MQTQPQSESIRALTTQFIADIETAVTEQAVGAVRGAILGSVLGSVGAFPESTAGKRGPGRPAKVRRKLPRQFCPVPKCKETAAPIFGMLCSKHRDTPKRLVKKYREARRAAKARA